VHNQVRKLLKIQTEWTETIFFTELTCLNILVSFNLFSISEVNYLLLLWEWL